MNKWNNQKRIGYYWRNNERKGKKHLTSIISELSIIMYVTPTSGFLVIAKVLFTLS